MFPSTIGAINQLLPDEKRKIYSRLIPPELLHRFLLKPDLTDSEGNDLLNLKSRAGSTDAEIVLYHQRGFPDPIFYGHIQDTINSQVHILLYVFNDPDSTRYDVDCMPDGTPTKFGIFQRNIEAEIAAMNAGLAPGQIRRGFRITASAIKAFESLIDNMGIDLYFAEPLYYHNAITFERFGFGYQKGKKLMERIQKGLCPSGDLLPRLDGSTPFRQPQAAKSIRLRSWAIHDGILGEPFNDVTVYKQIGKNEGVQTFLDCGW